MTTTGPYISSSVPSYFIRVSKAADPNSADPYSLNNGNTTLVDQRSVVDAGFLDLVRLGVLPASDPTIKSSLTVVNDTIEQSTPSGVGFYRYGTSAPGSQDGYGDCFEPNPPTPSPTTGCQPDGAPWPPTDTGTGHLWPVLSGERGEYEVAAGDPSFARSLLQSMQNMQSGQGLEPEQAWEDPDLSASPFGTDPATASIGFIDGQAAGSASPLTWAQAQYARLALDLSAGRNLETPSIVTDRYVRHGMPGSLPLVITSPAPGASETTASVTVTGTTAAGASVDAEAVGAAGGTAATAATTAGSSGNWTLSLPSSFGSTTITVTATKGDSTGYTQEFVTDVALPGTTVLNVTDPSGDDNGPGTYQYPTAAAFQPGAFDLLNLTVSQTSTDVYIQVKIRNLASTFGSNFGAQLLDVYVRNPAATSTSTAAAYPLMNYAIAPADAWSERLEAQGFTPVVWEDPSGASLGSAQFIVDQPSGTATLEMPISAFGTVGSNWVFTVALTGQGSGNPPVRNFTATPQQYSFGVCGAGGSNPSPICSVDPNTVPTVMDTFTPAGVTQATELNPTSGPVVLHGVTVP